MSNRSPFDARSSSRGSIGVRAASDSSLTVKAASSSAGGRGSRSVETSPLRPRLETKLAIRARGFLERPRMAIDPEDLRPLPALRRPRRAGRARAAPQVDQRPRRPPRPAAPGGCPDQQEVERAVEQREGRAFARARERGALTQLVPAFDVGGRQRPATARSRRRSNRTGAAPSAPQSTRRSRSIVVLAAAPAAFPLGLAPPAPREIEGENRPRAGR